MYNRNIFKNGGFAVSMPQVEMIYSKISFGNI